MDLTKLSMAELNALKDQKMEQVEAIKNEVQQISLEIKSRVSTSKVTEIVSKLTEEEKLKLITHLTPASILSNEKIGKLGG